MKGIVTRENPIWRATCDPAGARFDRIVEIRPDPDSRIGYPFILSRNNLRILPITLCISEIVQDIEVVSVKGE